MIQGALDPRQPKSIDELEALAREVRLATLRMAHDAKSPHLGPALSIVELLTALYFRALRIDPSSPGTGPSDDRFILSKGHGCMSYYVTLAMRGYFPREMLATYARNGSKLAEHPSPSGVPGIEVATGSLGHGLAMGAGTAWARKTAQRPGRVFVLLSDGECNEGSVWEAAMFASGRRLDQLVVLVDYNKLQAMGRSEEVTGLTPLADKWRAFGFDTREIDGHNLAEIVGALEEVPFAAGKPSAIVAHTVKGKGVSFMENNLEWHYRPPNDDDLARAECEILGGRP